MINKRPTQNSQNINSHKVQMIAKPTQGQSVGDSSRPSNGYQKTQSKQGKVLISSNQSGQNFVDLSSKDPL